MDPSLLNYDFENNTTEKIDKQLIFGSTCKESDVFVELKNKSELKVGSEIVVKNVGAYSVNEINSAILGVPSIYVFK